MNTEYRELVLAHAADGDWLHLKIVTNAEGRVAAHLPTTTGEARDFILPRVGATDTAYEHVVALEVGKNDIALEALRRFGAAFAVLDKSGAPEAWLQGYGDNAHLGAEVEVDENGVAWKSELAWTDDGVELEIYVPGLTTKGALAASTKEKGVRKLGLKVESKLIPRGSMYLRYVGLGGHALNNWRVGWTLNAARVPAKLKPGVYPVKVWLGDALLGERELRWEG